MIATFLIALLVGLFVGICSGLLGIGGGTIMVPVFRLVFGMAPVASTATSLFTIIPTSVAGAVSHVRGKTCVPRLGVALGVGGACLSPVGARLAQTSPGWLVMATVAVVVGYSALSMLRKAIGSNTSAPDLNAASDVDDNGLAVSKIAVALAIGAIAGLVSGFIGVGGGFLMVPLMVALLNMPMRLASGTSLIAVMILAVPATVVQCLAGNVDYLMGIAIACGSIPGAMVGARLITRMPERALRFAFSAFLGLAAILLVVNELGVFE